MSLSLKPPRPSVQWLGEPELAFAGGLTHIDPGAPDALPARVPPSRAADGADCTVCTGGSVHEPVHALPGRSPDASCRPLPPTGA